MKRSTVSFGSCLLLAAALQLFSCTTKVPVALTTPIAGEVGEISISIHTAGATQPFTYYGGRDTLFITFNTPVKCDIVNIIHLSTGSATIKLPVESFTQSLVSSLKIPIYWDVFPKLADRDSLNGRPSTVRYYDNLWLRVGSVESNTLRVYVDNTSPVIDSIKVGTHGYSLGANSYFSDTVFRFSADDTLTSVTLKAYGRDIGSTTNFGWSSLYLSSENPLSSPIGNSVNYRIGVSDFTDVVVLTANDGKGGMTQGKIQIMKGYTNPIIDSITLNTTKFAYAANSLYTVYALDSIALRAYARTEAAVGSWKCRNGTLSPRFIDGVTDTFAMMYKTSASGAKDTLLTDVTQIIDTLTFTLTNRFGQNTVQKIRIQKIPKNKRPVLDSIRVNNAITLDSIDYYNGGTWAATFTDTAIKTIPLRIYGHDQDGALSNVRSTLTRAVGFRGTFSADTGWAPIYTVASGLSYNDTFTVHVYDSLNFVASKQMILKIQRPLARVLSQLSGGSVPSSASLSPEKEAISPRGDVILREP